MRTAVIGFLIILIIWLGTMVWFYFNSSRPEPTVCLEMVSGEEGRLRDEDPESDDCVEPVDRSGTGLDG